MTPAQRLHEARYKLMRLRAASTPGPWMVDLDAQFITDEPTGTLSLVSDPHDTPGTFAPAAELIVTLHATIDAQLDILQHALARAEAKIAGGGVEHVVWSHTRDALALADAILGETP